MSLDIKVLAAATISGHEARGRVELMRADDGTVTIEVEDFWVSPGAPDVHLLISPRADGQVDHTAVDLGLVPDQERRLSRQLPAGVDPNRIRSVIVYYKGYSVYFGTGILNRSDLKRECHDN